jgi:MOSC domain-containing protein YiiM
MMVVTGVVVGVHLSTGHSFSKRPQESVRLLAGLGVEGDAHCGATMRHRGRLPRDASKPNLRQVHLLHAELHDHLGTKGFRVEAGSMGENITTRGVELLSLPRGSRLHVGEEAVVEVTGLRNPCKQLDGLQPGLMAATTGRDASGGLLRLAGVMVIVVLGGDVWPGDRVVVELPPLPHHRLEPV